ncbi:MAG: hypothetical protein Q9208_008210 [Pyrenodesmia sp. 3 TL-2023]
MATYQPTAPGAQFTLGDNKPTVVGLYGISGCGKTKLLNDLKPELGEDSFIFWDGSEKIDSIVPDGLKAFQAMGKAEQDKWRKRAVISIGEDSKANGKTGVVAGHFMFWLEGQEAEQACTQADLDMYTHIIYLEIPPGEVLERRSKDTGKHRESASMSHLGKWQQLEKDRLRQICRKNNILFLVVAPQLLNKWSPSNKVSTLIRDFQRHSENYNSKLAKVKLDEAIGSLLNRPETMLVLDADKTIATEDTGKLFWKTVSDARSSEADADTLADLFGGPLGYSYNAFRQATLLYEETADDWQFEGLCKDVAEKVTLHPEFLSLLRKAAEEKHVSALLLTSGLRRVWELVLERNNLSKTVTVIGGGRIADGIVVTGAVKGGLVSRLRSHYQMHVWAFGDSPIDMEMLKAADEAIVVVGEEKTRSKSMEQELSTAISNGLSARQIILPNTVSPRLDNSKLPVVDITTDDFLNSVLRHRSPRILLASDRTSAKLLMTPTRNAAIGGPALRKAHRRIGWYLATEFVTNVIGLEKYSLPHVLGRATIGYRIAHEPQTLIIALMRGGEPMTMGVSEAFPQAMVVHAKHPDEIKRENLQKAHTLIIVDSVVNTGKSMVEFVDYIRKEYAQLPIVLLANVVQDQSVTHGALNRILEEDSKVNLVALRLSTTSYVGSGVTDTGNRLFNTTHLD